MVNPSDFKKIYSSRNENTEKVFEKRAVPKGSKDFKKVLEEASEDSKKDDEEVIAEASGRDAQAEEGLPSLLSLASKQKSKLLDSLQEEVPEYAEGEAGEKPVADSKTDKAKKMPSKYTVDERSASSGKEEMIAQDTPKPSLREKVTDKEDSEGSPFSVFKQVQGKDNKEKGFSQFTQDQSDLSYLNPLQGSLEGAASTQAADVKPASRAAYIQDIVNQMVAKLQTVRTEGKTDTIITLKQPPMFDGVNLIVTSFDSAKKEFNIAFENLSPQAKQMLDLQQNRTDLKLALEEKGYGVHIIVTTTEVEHPVTVAQNTAHNDARERRQDGEQPRQQKRQKQQG
jgi:hypothetical protein